MKTMSAKEAASLAICRGENLAGQLKRTASGCEIHFDKAFLENPNYQCLSFRIPKSTNPYVYTGAGLPPFFAGLLPEGWRFKALVQSLKTSEDDLFTMLAQVGQKTIGDVWVKGTQPNVEIKNLSQVDFFELLDQSVSDQANASIAGVQEKISASMISFPVKLAKRGQEFILKLNPKDRPNLIENEFWTLELAKKVGLKTNVANLVEDKNGTPGLLVTRFDRLVVAGKTRMRHQEDLLQLMNLFPADKYRVKLQSVIETIQDVCAAGSIQALRVLELYLFSYLVGNGDLHAKNMSVHWSNDKGLRELTPAYDLISTTVYGDHKAALELDGRDDNFTLKQITEFAKRNGVNAHVIEELVNRLLLRFSKNIKLFERIAPDAKGHAWLTKEFNRKAKRLRG